MFKYTANLVLGILVVLVPFSGFPRSWRTCLFVIFGLLIALFSYLARRERNSILGNTESVNPKLQKGPELFIRQKPVEEIVRPRLPRYEEMYAERATEPVPASKAKPLFYATETVEDEAVSMERPTIMPMTIIDSVLEVEEVEEPETTMLPEPVYFFAPAPEPITTPSAPRRKRKTLPTPALKVKVEKRGKSEKPAAKRKSRAKVVHTHEE